MKGKEKSVQRAKESIANLEVKGEICTNKSERKEILNKEIDLIQSCIKRMSQNSFMVKGWLISLIAVVLTLLPEKFDLKILCSVGCIVVICFWMLDAFFLKTEKLYRMKYDWVIKNRMYSNKFLFDLNPHNPNMWLKIKDRKGNYVSAKEPSIIETMFTLTTALIYVPLVLLTGFVFYINCI